MGTSLIGSAIVALLTVTTAHAQTFKVTPETYTRTFAKNGAVIEVRHKDGWIRTCRATEVFFPGNPKPGYTIRCSQWFNPRKISEPGTH